MLSLKRAAWSFGVLSSDVVISGQRQATNIPNRLHAGLRLRLPVTSFTCLFRPLPIATGVGGVEGVADLNVSFETAQMSFKVKFSVRSTGATLYTVTARSTGRRFYIRLSLS